MITPLSIRAPKILSECCQAEITPQNNPNRRTDSLVFSITSQKYNSQWDTNLLDSKNEKVSKELQSLQTKLQNLESRVCNMTQNSLIVNDFNSMTRQKQHIKCWYENSKESYKNKQNQMNDTNKTQIGKIINRKSSSKGNKPSHMKQKTNQISFRGSRNTVLSDSFQKSRQLTKTKKDFMKMKLSFERSQKSFSICSQKLQNSKSLVKNMKKQSKNMKKTLETLKINLKKSENIRMKQKQQILRQKKQIQHYKKLLIAKQTQKLR